MVLGWWFDWLPHHGLEDTQSENRYRATRNRVGLEWLFTPLMLSQNYHLVHHLHPSVPFYRYLRDLAAQRGGLPGARRGDLDRVRQVAQPRGVPGVEAAQQQAAEGPAGADADRLERATCRVSSDAGGVGRSDHRGQHAGHLRGARGAVDQFRFEPGQHVTVKTDLGGEGVRRNYSICAPATRASCGSPSSTSPGGVLDIRRRAAEGGRRAGGDDPDRPVLPAAGSAQPQALRRARRRQRDHPDPLDPPDRARARGRQPVHADLRQPHATSRRCSEPSSTSWSPATPTGSRSCTSSPATRSTPRPVRPDRPRQARAVAGERPRSPRPSTSGSCAARSD